MIESNQNAQIKNILHLKKSAKFRSKSGSFIIEGWKMIEEAIAVNLIKKIYVTYTEQSKLHELFFNLRTQIAFEVVNDKIFAQISDTMNPQGVLAVVNMPNYENFDKWGDEGVSKEKSSWEILSGKKSSLLCLEDINDPGNLGTMIRTAEGAGFAGVILSKGTVDVFNPKVVRATMGSLFRVPLLVADDFFFLMKELKEKGFHLYAAHLHGEKLYNEESYKGSIAILIGNEANGLSEQCTELANTKLKIPMEGKLESLNAAVCAGILMYEARKR